LKTQKTESLGRMAGAIAHLFNNKLSVVQGNLELSMGRLSDRDDIQENLRDAIEASKEAAEISGLMLSYLGIGLGKCKLIDLSRGFRESLPLLQDTLPTGIILETDVVTDSVVVNANTKQLWQAVSQLLSNAGEAIGPKSGKVNLSIKTIAASDIPRADLSPADWEPTVDRLACIQVKDTGCGIAADDMDKIFDPFFTTKFTGRGLGLAVTLGYVKAWYGAIGLESKVGHGTVARVNLPLAQDHIPSTSDKKTAKIYLPAEGDTVLLVDDQESVLRLGSKMLKFLGYNVLTASCGSEALELFRQNRNSVRCAITDLTMPDMDGRQTLASLREIDPDLPVMLSSGYNEAEVMITNGADQPHAFLHKPYSLKELKQKLSQVFEDKV